jgi:long-chain acyl-CoA synthetase
MSQWESANTYGLPDFSQREPDRSYAYKHIKCMSDNEGQVISAFPSFPDCFTLRDLFDAMVDRYSGYPMYGDFSRNSQQGRWITYGEFGDLARSTAVQLLHLGTKYGDIVGVIMGNSSYFALAQWVLGIIGATILPIEKTYDAEAIRDTLHILVVTSLICSAETFAVLRSQVLDRPIPTLRRIIVFCDDSEIVELELDPDDALNSRFGVPFHSLPSILRSRDTATGDSPRKLSNLLANSVGAINMGGGRRGVWLPSCLTHANLIAAAAGITTCNYPFGRDIYLSQLSMSRAFERSMQLAILAHGGCVAFCHGGMLETIQTVRPTVFACLGSALQELAQELIQAALRENCIKRMLFDFAFSLAVQAMDTQIDVPWFFREALLEPFRGAVGGRLRLIVSSCWTLQPRVQYALRAMLQIPVIQIYGATECGGVICTQQVGDPRAGNVGGPAVCCEIQIREWEPVKAAAAMSSNPADFPGEILVRGPNVFKGYHKTRKKTTDAFLDGGWFRTGDLGRIHPDGTLQIEDRILDWERRTRSENPA